MVKIYILELTSPICDKDKSLLLSELDNSELETLPNPREKNFELSLIGKVLAKRIISDTTLTPIKSVLVGKTKLGKPVVKTPDNLNLDISISHSGNYLAVGICDNGQIGIDIELLKDVDFRVLKNCFSVSEEMYINSGKGITQRLGNFYEIWTRKEAYVKALGTGLQRPMPLTQFYPGQTKPRTEIRYNNQQYYLSTLKEDKFVLTVCATSSTLYDHSYTKPTLDKLWSSINNQETTSSGQVKSLAQPPRSVL